MLDFNKGSVNFYSNSHINKYEILQTATIEEIMEFDDMPVKTYTEIVEEMNDRFKIWYNKYSKVNEELNKLNKLKQDAKRQCAGNIEYKVNRLIYDMEVAKREISKKRRVFYYRLKALDLIEEE